MRLFVSFSAGESSAKMVAKIAEGGLPQYTEIVYGFANTGEEDERSLQFADYVDRTFLGGQLVWLESVVKHNRRESCGHRIVSFDLATRGPALFESMAQKYGLPNKAYPHCTRSLKLDPITSYLRAIGWDAGSYATAIGIRKDEADRVSSKAMENRIIYPLISKWPSTKKDVNEFWDKQPRRLDIKGYEGNCVWCWKKTLRKHYTLMSERPEAYNTPRMLEKNYGLSGHNLDGTPRRIFRENRLVADIEREAAKGFEPFHDENRVYNDPQLDLAGGCGDSCEVFTDELTAGGEF